MVKTKLLLINYFPRWLIDELVKRDYEITTVNVRENSYPPILLDKKKFDLVYFAKFYPPLWDDFTIFLNQTKIPVIYAFHSPLLMLHPYRPTNHILNLISLMKLAYIKTTKNVAAIHVLNTSDYNILRILRLKCFYIPLGVNTDLFDIGLKRSKFTVVFVGPRYGKGADMLTKIIPEVLERAPDIQFILAGKGFLNYFPLLERIFKDNVQDYGWLKQEEFAKLLSSSHTLLFPSRYESFGLVVLEALSSGLPVLCFDIPGTPRDIVKKNGIGIVVKPFNIDRLVNGLLEYYYLWKENSDEFKRLSIKCRNVALKYDVSIVANLFDNMFSEVLHSKKYGQSF
jgi:glycosyltransferase involved in cell wall biosynthesis